MHCYEFQTMRRWLAARLRARGFEVDEEDLDIADCLADLGLRSVTDVIRLDDAGIDDIVHRLGDRQSRRA